MRHKALLAIFTLVAGLLLVWGCSTQSSSSDLRPHMRDAYQTTSELFTYVWSPKEFRLEANEKRILTLIDRLATDFHKVEKASSSRANEPGFRIALLTQQERLKDIELRFKQGAKDYANWRLRGLSANCIACHSRFEVPADFFGAEPVTLSSSYEAQLASAEFLIASRQFEKAEKRLMDLTTTLSSSRSGGPHAMRALKLWLIIQVRVTDHASAAADELDGLRENSQLPSRYNQIIKQWSSDLRMLKADRAKEANSLTRARSLLINKTGLPNINEDELSLVPTLRATALLHRELQYQTDPDTRRESLLLLATAYLHTPILSLELYREMYLEQCIREFPGTQEAQRAYGLYEGLVETTHSGSGGLHLEPEDSSRLAELKKLAFS